MQKGLDLIALATEVAKQREQNRDFIVDTREMQMELHDNKPALYMHGTPTGPQAITEHAHNQIGARLKIPAIYYDRLRKDYPDLLATNVNELFNKEPERRMVRTSAQGVRAFLSDRYRRLDNYEVMGHAVLPILQHADVSLEVMSSQVTETRMYIKVASKTIRGEIKKGDEVQAGFILSNSEIGMGSLSVTPYITRLVCLNGMKVDSLGKRKYHVGKQVEDSGELFSDDTLKADDHAFMLKVRDLVSLAVDQQQFDKLLEVMRRTETVAIERPLEAVQELGKAGFLKNGEIDLVSHFLLANSSRDGLTQFGMMNAITAAAGVELIGYDRATELEGLGGDIMLMEGRDFQHLIKQD